MNEWAWKHRKKKVIPEEPKPLYSSKWEERVAEMQRRKLQG